MEAARAISGVVEQKTTETKKFDFETSIFIISDFFSGILWIIFTIIAGLVAWFLLIFSFGVWAKKNNTPPPFDKIHSDYRKDILSTIDRAGVVIIAFIATLPGFQPYLRQMGVIGLTFMIIVFVFRGHFTALVKDALQKSPKKLSKASEKSESVE